jgi:hypothetical protein
MDVPFLWRYSQHIGEPVGLVKLCIAGSTLLRTDQGVDPAAFFGPFLAFTTPYGPPSPRWYSWWTPRDQFDFHPATGRLYQSWLQKMAGAQAARGAGNEMDVRQMVLWFGDNDSTLGLTDNARTREFEDVARLFVDTVRRDLVANNWTTLPEEQIPIIWMGVHNHYNSPIAVLLNAALQNIAADDPWFTWIDTNGQKMLSDVGFTDPGHLSHLAYLALADKAIDAAISMETIGFDALANEQRISLGEVVLRVKTYYERNRVKTDASATAIRQHINGALMHILNFVGDQAYWLMRITTMSISTSPFTLVQMPKSVHRLLRIEPVGHPGYPLQFEQIGHTNGGHMQIILKETFTGSFNVQYITHPREMTSDAELVPLPFNLIEWLVVEAALRLSYASGTAALQGNLTAQAAQLKTDSMRNMGAVRRSAFDRMHVSRRLPTRRNLSFFRTNW